MNTSNTTFDIGIVTFNLRFEMLKGLVESIRKFNKTTNIIVNVNGCVKSEFDENYRKQLYEFLAKHPKTFAHIWPQFRSLAKGWNTCIIAAVSEHVLVLNDDSIITSEKFFEDVQNGINQHKGLFTIRKDGFNHFVANKFQLHQLGYFDERLIAWGSEDADMQNRYRHYYGTNVPFIESEHITNLDSNIVDYDFQKWNHNGVITKYPVMNLIIFHKKINERWGDIMQYPYETFFLKNRHQMSNITELDYSDIKETI